MSESVVSSRVSNIAILILVVLVGFAGRLAWIQLIDGPRLSAEATLKHTAQQTIHGRRGEITDTNGVVLAQSVDRFDITVSPRNANQFTRDGKTITVDMALNEIAAITGGDIAAMRSAIALDPQSDFAYLVKAVTVEDLKKVRALQIPWVYKELHPYRTYPRGAVAGNLIGFMGTDGPLAGIEYYLNDCLKATNGKSMYEKGLDGVVIPGSEVVTVPAVDGGAVQLTIDSDLQWFAQQLLIDQGTQLQAQWATALVVKIDTGEILAAADWPSVDPNAVTETDSDDRGSRLFTSPYEPGSTIKPLIVSQMMDDGLITPGTKIVVPSKFALPGGDYVRDHVPHGTLQLTTTGVLVNSSNIGIDILSFDLTKKQRYDYLTDFGIGTETGVHFLGEDSGQITKPDVVDSVTQYTEMFGQGFTVTSAQVAQAYQTIGNGGVRQPLSLVKSCTDASGKQVELKRDEPKRVLTEKTANTVLEMLENVATKSSARKSVSIPGYRVGIKTGTAEVARNGVYTKDMVISIAGIVPADNPKYTVVVTFGLPKYHRSSKYAGPAFSALVEQTVKYFRVPPSTGKTPDYPAEW
ncbi:MAG: peptidoglycan D,D-transpeptidase FtsI family protein [Microbacteriaceae bacterium]